jgi:hypothetical protein
MAKYNFDKFKILNINEVSNILFSPNNELLLIKKDRVVYLFNIEKDNFEKDNFEKDNIKLIIESEWIGDCSFIDDQNIIFSSADVIKKYNIINNSTEDIYIFGDDIRDYVFSINKIIYKNEKIFFTYHNHINSFTNIRFYEKDIINKNIYECEEYYDISNLIINKYIIIFSSIIELYDIDLNIVVKKFEKNNTNWINRLLIYGEKFITMQNSIQIDFWDINLTKSYKTIKMNYYIYNLIYIPNNTILISKYNNIVLYNIDTKIEEGELDIKNAGCIISNNNYIFFASMHIEIWKYYEIEIK